MDKKYSDSLIPVGIGVSFFLFLIILLSLGALAGYYFEDKSSFQQLGGIPLLFAILVILVGPIYYNKKESHFEKGKKIVEKSDFFGTVQGLRGAFIRLLLYVDGLEIRAFYHRYYIPFNKIRNISIADGKISKKLNVDTGIDGVPNYIIASGKQFLSLAFLIEKSFISNQANSADTKSGAAD